MFVLVLPEEGVERCRSLPSLISDEEEEEEERLEKDPFANENDFLVNAESREEVSCVCVCVCSHLCIGGGHNSQKLLRVNTSQISFCKSVFCTGIIVHIV